MALVDDGVRSAAARAAAPTELVVVLRETFMRALAEEPELSRHIIRSLVQRLRAADEKLEAFAYLDAEGRVARVLIDVAGDGMAGCGRFVAGGSIAGRIPASTAEHPQGPHGQCSVRDF